MARAAGEGAWGLVSAVEPGGGEQPCWRKAEMLPCIWDLGRTSRPVLAMVVDTSLNVRRFSTRHCMIWCGVVLYFIVW